jgi:serine/threonine protein kinase/Tfp pilus assembly protein PilF
LPDKDKTSAWSPESNSGPDRVSAGTDVAAVRVAVGSPSSEATPWLPESIGRYRILRLLGEGGMGAVYVAEQENPHRTVALKVIRAGYADSELVRRFENEAQALGRLHHPGIAQIYEAGTADTPFGRQPYFAMELVHGQTLLAYCDQHHLNVRQRLELAAKIADAVQHAHQRGLIHRDLKPANILVDEAGQPRILDFGVARLTDADTQATRQTNIGQLIGTLAYMSPEQVQGDPDALDTRSDVYALGVILYEMLAGKLPYTLPRQLHDVVRTIQQTEASPLSTMVKSYRGDIETIVAKALEKDKTRRYASAAELAADIRRHLHDEPIVARPPSTIYQLSKFARRNRALVTGVAAVFAVLVLGIVASAWEAVQARRAAKHAEQESAISRAVNDFLQKDLLGQASAENQSKPDPNITVRTVLDRAAQNIEGKFAGQPAVEAAIRETIGQTYFDIALYPEAEKQLQKALTLSSHALGDEDPETLLIQFDLAQLALDEGKFAQAEALDKKILDIRRRVLGQEHPDTLRSMSALAYDYTQSGNYVEAEALQQKTLEIRRRVLGLEHPKTLDSMNNLGYDYEIEGKYAQASELLTQALDIQRRVLGPEHPDTLRSMSNLAGVYTAEGKYAQAETLNQKVLETRRRVLGPEHGSTLISMSQLAFDYKGEGKHSQAVALFQELLEIQPRVWGPNNPLTLQSFSDLAGVYADEGRFAQAEDLYRQGLKIAPKDSGLLNWYAWFLLTAKDPNFRRPKEALDLARKAVSLAQQNGDDLNTLGLAEVRNGLWNEAIATLTKSVALHNSSDSTDFLFLAMAYQGKGDKPEAEKNYAHGAEMARESAAANPELRMLWTEAAKALGKPAPNLTATK